MQTEEPKLKTRIQQSWIILSNGVCAVHWLYSGWEMDENLFAAFVRALFSFSKDMGDSDIQIRNMSFGNMDIHYLPDAEERLFCAISVDQGTPAEQIQEYLEYISYRFQEIFSTYVEFLPPFEPEAFPLFNSAIDKYLAFHEDTYFLKQEGINDYFLRTQIKSIQYAQNHILVDSSEDEILRLFTKDPFMMEGTFFPTSGKKKSYSLQKKGEFLTILSDKAEISIIPLIEIEESQIRYKVLKEENQELTWITTHPTKPLVLYGNKNKIIIFDLVNEEKITIDTSYEIKSLLITDKNQIVVLSTSGEILTCKFPITKENFLQLVEYDKSIKRILSGPQSLIILWFDDHNIALWDIENLPVKIKGIFSDKAEIGVDDSRNLIFIISEENALHIFTEKGDPLVTYNLINQGSGCIVSEKDQILILYKNGLIHPFTGTINRNEIQNNRTILSRRIDTVENHITRIYNGMNNIIEEMEEVNRSSTELQNDIKQIRVFRQQLKRLIDKRLLERTSILLDIFLRLQSYEKQVSVMLPMIDDLLIALQEQYETVKESELSGKKPEERIDDYIEKMKARQQIGIGSMANELHLSYDIILKHLQILEGRGLLPGWLTRGTSTSIRDNILFVKRDPKLQTEGDHITSF
ncbi:MAG: hypothetical protein ACXAC7_05025 [Candidatus Hodarchaeales archaeon]|jgi:hypothetical protein